LEWARMVGILEFVYNQGLPFQSLRGVQGQRRGEKDGFGTFFKVVDVKPLAPVVVSNVIDAYKWWGFIDNDMWLGDIRGKILPLIARDDVDFYGIKEYVNAWGTHTGPSFGAFTLTRSEPKVTYNLLLTPHAIGVIRKILDTASPQCFSEWGNPGFNCMGYEYSYSGLAKRAARRGHVRVAGSYGVKRPHHVAMVWDSPDECHPPHFPNATAEDPNYVTVNRKHYPAKVRNCSLSPMSRRPKALYKTCIMKQTNTNGSAIKTHLLVSNCKGKTYPVAYCHFEFGKFHPSMKRPRSNEAMLRLFRAPVVARSFECGAFVPPQGWV